jgi:putative ABC transport system ATP-binding protein
MALIELEGITRSYMVGGGELKVLKGIDLTIEEGEFVAIMGPSGSGKSTLIANLSGLLKPEEGRVDILDVDDLWKYGSGRIDKFRLDHCGFIFQGFNLFPSLTALQQVMTVLKYQGLSKSEARARATTALEEVGLGHRLNQRPSALSGGEKQRVAIARALAKNPQILFADEPTSALDGENGQVVIRLLRRAATEHGAAVICVTHDPRLEAWADRVIHIEDGKILDDQRRIPNPDAQLASH